MGRSQATARHAPRITRGARERPKLALSVAGRIVDDVVAGGWAVGDVIGSEPELLARYGVSRAVFREAVRLVEHLQVARMRRGPGGGLVVTEPTTEAVSDAILMHLHRLGPSLDELFEARIVVEGVVAELATARLDEAGMGELRRVVADEAAGRVGDPRALHDLLTRISGNPALELFVKVLNQLLLLHIPNVGGMKADVRRASAQAHDRIAAAVLAGDAARARRRMRTHLEAEATRLHRRRPAARPVVPAPADGGGRSKRAESVARAIHAEAAGADWRVGYFLGSEAELMERHDVSRAVLREAVRLLELHGIAATRRGPGGGVFVAEPSLAGITDAVAVYLASHGIGRDHVIELRRTVETAQVELAVDGLDDEGAERLAATLEAEQRATVDDAHEVHDLHAVVASLTGNRVLELVTLVLIRLSRLHRYERPGVRLGKRLIEQGEKAHAGIVDALVARDVALATHRMRRHLEACARSSAAARRAGGRSSGEAFRWRTAG